MPQCGAAGAGGGSGIGSSAEQSRCTLGPEQVRHVRPRGSGLPLVDLGRGGDLHGAILRGHSPVQPAPFSPLPAPAVGGDRRLTSALERGEEAPLRRYLARARRILERRQCAAGLAVVRADLEAERPLAWRRHDVQRIEPRGDVPRKVEPLEPRDRKSTRLNSSHVSISYAVFCLKKKKNNNTSR